MEAFAFLIELTGCEGGRRFPARRSSVHFVLKDRMRSRLASPAIVMLFFAALTITSAARTHRPIAVAIACAGCRSAITKLARQQFVSWQAGNVNQHLYAVQVHGKLTDEKVAETSRALGQLGALNDAVYIGPWADSSARRARTVTSTKWAANRGNIYLWLALDAQGRIATIFLRTGSIPRPLRPPRARRRSTS